MGCGLIEAALAWAVDSGFAGTQCNPVIEGKPAAEKLYADLGFVTIGTIPGAFDPPDEGRVGLHVLYRPLSCP